jgi:death-on-curing protein
MAVFLETNGLALKAEEVDVVTTMVALAAGALDQEMLAQWIRAHANEKGAESALQVSPPGPPRA